MYPTRCLGATLLALLVPGVFAQQSPAANPGLSFYFSPHPDDWQLFMNPDAYNDVQNPAMRVVFVYITAGDSGQGIGPATAAHPYYAARENGARMSVRFLVDVNNVPQDVPLTPVSINGHTMVRYVYGNTVSYFLRLPDGGVDGAGYASTGMQSVGNLEAGQIASIRAIDQSTTYNGWSDLTATLTVLIRSELGTCNGGWAHYADPDPTYNPGDHPDHIATAHLVDDALARESYFNRAYYVDYASADLPGNLSTDDQQVETATYAQVLAGRDEFGWPITWDSSHRGWLGRNYYRVVNVSTPPLCGTLSRSACPPFDVKLPFPQRSATCRPVCCRVGSDSPSAR